MPELLGEQRQEIIEALIALDWTVDQESASRHLISKLCACSPEKAEAILHKIHADEKPIESINDTRGTLWADIPMETRRRWLRRSR